MDKVRQILGVLKKHHFWIVSVMVSAAILGCWYSARASLSQKYQTEKSGIDSIFSSLQTISSNPAHPNPSFKTGVEQEKEKLKKTTDAEWQQLYDRQKAVFVWPEALPKFKEWEAASPKKPMTPEMLQQYQAFIDSEFPKLEALVNVRREKNPTGTTTPGVISPMMRQPSFPMTGVTPGAEMIGVIDWEPADFMRMKSNLKTWNTTTPTQREVELCHESLAIYRSLLEAIAKVNVAATDNENAIVKKIIALDIGKDASVPGTYDVSNVIMPTELAPGGGAEGASPYSTMAPPITTGPEGAAGAADVNKDVVLLDQRYLDGAGAPVMGDAILNSPPFAEFKLMKVRLLLVVDQRGIPSVLAELANAKLGVEVHQVRLNPQNSTVVQSVRTLLTSAGGGATGGYPGAGRPGEGGATRPTSMPTRSPYGPGATGRPPAGAYGRSTGRSEGGATASLASGTGTENPNDATVEIKGIIYIYNPANPEKTGSGTDTTNVDQRTMFGFAGASGAAGGAPAAAAPL